MERASREVGVNPATELLEVTIGAGVTRRFRAWPLRAWGGDRDRVRRYATLPTPLSPRVIIPMSSLRLAVWAHRAGILGGGRSLLTRCILRTPIAFPLLLLRLRSSVLEVDARETK